MTDARLILDLLPKPVAIVDAVLVVHDANRAFAARFGLARAEGMTASRAGFWSQLTAALARMQPAAKVGVFRWVDRDGEDRPFDVRLTRVSPERVLLVADDVSPYAQVEAIQGGVRNYLERVLNRLRLAVIVLDGDLRVTLYNEAQAHLWARLGLPVSPVEIIGAAVSGMYPALSEEQWGAVGTAVQDGRSVRFAELSCGTGHPTVDLEVLPLHSPGEPALGAICLTDVLPTG